MLRRQPLASEEASEEASKEASEEASEEALEDRLPRWLPDPIRKLQPTRWWFFPPVALGLLVLALTVALSSGIERDEGPPAPLPVRVMLIEPQSVTPTLKGFGEIRPRHRWGHCGRLLTPRPACSTLP